LAICLAILAVSSKAQTADPCGDLVGLTGGPRGELFLQVGDFVTKKEDERRLPGADDTFSATYFSHVTNTLYVFAPSSAYAVSNLGDTTKHYPDWQTPVLVGNGIVETMKFAGMDKNGILYGYLRPGFASATLDVYASDFEDQKWHKITEFAFDNNTLRYTFGTFSADREDLVFSAWGRELETARLGKFSFASQAWTYSPEVNFTERLFPDIFVVAPDNSLVMTVRGPDEQFGIGSFDPMTGKMNKFVPHFVPQRLHSDYPIVKDRLLIPGCVWNGERLHQILFFDATTFSVSNTWTNPFADPHEFWVVCSFTWVDTGNCKTPPVIV